MEKLPEKKGLNLHPTIKSLIKLAGLALLAALAQGCDGKNPNEAMLQAVEKQKTTDTNIGADVERIRQECEGGVIKTGGLIQCLDENGITEVVTSLGD